MSTDLQVVWPQDLIPLTGVRLMFGNPPTLDVLGEDFRNVDEVLVNEVPAPSVIIVSKTRLLVQVPTPVAKQRITSVSVISNRLTVTERSLIRFRFGKTSKKVSGLLRLVQLFLKVLFTTQGTDIFAPNLGGNGLRALGKNFSKDQQSSIVSDLVISVDTTARQIISIQSRDPSLPRSERLLTAKLTSTSYNRNETALMGSIELVNQTGQRAIANLEL